MMHAIEYQVESVIANDLPSLTAQLNSFGAAGWDIIAVLPLAGRDHVLYMKRQKGDK